MTHPGGNRFSLKLRLPSPTVSMTFSRRSRPSSPCRTERIFRAPVVHLESEVDKTECAYGLAKDPSAYLSGAL